MAKYTRDDPDIQYLDAYDKNDYNFELIKYDVDKNQDAYIAKTSVKFITNPSLIGDLFKGPKEFTVGIFAIVVFILIVIIIIFIIIFIILKILGGSENEIRREIMKKIMYYSIICMLFLVLLYWYFNKIILETTSTGFIVKV
jgi:flagellar biosynthesis/type III secretory pathway M-ring protein FliF/YscJ